MIESERDSNGMECTACNVFKEWDMFHKKKKSPTGHSYVCKVCKSEIDARYRKENKKHLQQYIAGYYQNNSNIMKERSRKHRKDNKEHWKEYHHEYHINTRTKDEKSKNIRNIRTMLRDMLRNVSSHTSTKYRDLIGCSTSEFILYIEAQFDDKMCWENHTIDGWHFEHIKPLEEFDLFDIEQRNECFHFSNTRPLWGDENLEKGSSFTEEESVAWEDSKIRNNNLMVKVREYIKEQENPFHSIHNKEKKC